ncbi:MAG TPA: diguanylate cyclase, partial [Candidatus Angelobacter sp.]|nr:diguanylate cyclase [Candidatus Angelobacter sp.]
MTKMARLNVTAWLGRRSRFFLSSLAVFGLLFVSCVRYFTPAELQVTFLFLLPISFATWFLSTLIGSLFAAGATGVLLFFDLRSVDNIHHNVLVANTLLNLAFFSAVVFIFSEVRALYDREQQLSLHDALTGLLNHRAFVDKVATENRRLQRHPGSLTLVYIDLDEFKRVN